MGEYGRRGGRGVALCKKGGGGVGDLWLINSVKKRKDVSSWVSQGGVDIWQGSVKGTQEILLEGKVSGWKEVRKILSIGGRKKVT